MLQFSLRLDEEEIQKSQDDVIGWFNSICRSVTAKSLVVEVCGFTKEAETCNKIQDTLLALNARIETLSVYLFDTDRSWDEMDNVRKLFPKLYEKGIVIKKRLDDDKSVCHYFLTFKLPY